MSKPEIMAVPLVALMSPVNILNVVVFPAPEDQINHLIFQILSFSQ